MENITTYASKFGKLSSGHRTGKGQFLFQSQRKAMPKNAQTTTQLGLFHMLTCNAQNPSRQASTACELRTYRCTRQTRFRKGIGTRDQIANIHWIIEKARELQNNICFTDSTKAFDCVDHNKLQNSSRDGNTRPPYLPPEKPVLRSRSNN